MTKNTISVTAYIVTGSDIKILLNESPHQAIEKYLCPDMRPPIDYPRKNLCNDCMNLLPSTKSVADSNFLRFVMHNQLRPTNLRVPARN